MIPRRETLYLVCTEFFAKKQLRGNTQPLKTDPVIKLSHNTSCMLLLHEICGGSNYLSNRKGLVTWRLINQHVQITL